MLTLADFPKPVTAAAAKAAHLDGLLRYWQKQGGSTVVIGLSKAECADLLANGVPFGTVYEGLSASWMSGGYAAGVAAGNWLKTQFAAAGYTPPCVYLAADATTLATAAVNACLDGAASVLGRDMVGLYAFLPQLQSAHDGAHASRFWLCGHYVDPAAYPWINVYQCQGSQPAPFPTTVEAAGQTGDGDMGFASDWGQSGADMTDIFDTVIYTRPTTATIAPGDGRTAREILQFFDNVLLDGGPDAVPPNGESLLKAVGDILTGVNTLQAEETTDQATLAKILTAATDAQTGQVDITSLANQLAGALVPVLSTADAQQFVALLAGKLNAASGQ